MSGIRLYYCDGYHGGIRGHMPIGCWRDILERFRKEPEWKISIDMEPVSWDYIRSRDPETYDALRELLRDQSVASRVEMVSGSYAQPYGWITDGESNIRHLTLGLKLLKQHFPWLRVDTYAVQEPCWTSAMPQMLHSLGFTRAVLKDPSTAWGGYCAGFDAEVCIWEGPDGTRIPMVPRYECEDLVNVWETESCYGKLAFAEKCVEHGIEHPTGMYYQDLGWAAFPRLMEMPQFGGDDCPEHRPAPDHVTYVTWKEYFSRIASPPSEIWKVSQEAFQGALPWGDRILVRMSRQVRRGEIGMLAAERLDAIAHAFAYSSPNARLEEAWGHVLMTQHHDGWICAGAGHGERNWAWKTSAQIYAAEALTDPANRQALYALGAAVCKDVHKEGNLETLVAVNLLGRTEKRVIEAPMTANMGTLGYCVTHGDRHYSAQVIPNRTYRDDDSFNAGALLFEADMPGYSVSTFKVTPLEMRPMREPGAHARVEGGTAYVENDLYTIAFDLSRGGVITSFYDKARAREIVDINSAYGFNEYRGYFVKQGAFFSSMDNAATAEVLADGPIRAILCIKGCLSDASYTQIFTLDKHARALKCRVMFDFPKGTYIGEPHEIEPGDKRKDGYRSYHDGRYKLNAFFPTAFAQDTLNKNAAYDVCKSQLADTHFKKWDEIKHNILISWADVCDGAQGLTLFTDHTAGYTHGGGYPLGLHLAWGWDGGFWWGRRELKGMHEMEYMLMPHGGDWRDADVWHENEQLSYPVMTQRVVGALKEQATRSLIDVSGGLTELSAAYLDEGNRLIVRLFNPGVATRARIKLDARYNDMIEQINLDGSVICALEHSVSAFYCLDIPEYGLITLRASAQN